MTTQPTAPRQQSDLAQRPKLLFKVVAWVCVAWGVVAIFAGAFPGDVEMSSLNRFGMMLFGLIFIIPAVRWMYCSAQDVKAIEAYEESLRTNESLAHLLTEEDKRILQGMGGIQPPKRTKRHWKVIVGICIALFAAMIPLMQ